jgi:protein-tyrosine-phosphatase
VNPLGIQMMKEIGIDITAQRSKHMNDFLQQNMETVITVCVFTAYAEGRRDQLKATE